MRNSILEVNLALFDLNVDPVLYFVVFSREYIVYNLKLVVRC